MRLKEEGKDDVNELAERPFEKEDRPSGSMSWSWSQFPLRTLNMKDNAKCIKRQDEDEVTETKS